MLKLSNWLYSVLLYSFPMPFRVRFGDTMRQTFRDQIRDALKQYGKAGALELWVFTCFDVLLSALAEHKREMIEMPIQKLFRWSGPAIALGGATWSIGVLLLLMYVRTEDNVAAISLFLTTLVLIAWGLIGLYYQLPTQSRPYSIVVMLVACGGLAAYNLATFASFFTIEFREQIEGVLLAGGYVSFWLGLAGMGIISLRNKSLAGYSFAPLLPAFLGPLFLFLLLQIDYTRIRVSTAQTLVGVFYALSWLFLGFAMWKAHEKQVVQNQFA